MIPAFNERILLVDVAWPFAPRRCMFPTRPRFESLIGATALVYGMIMVTRNIRDLEPYAGLEVVNPWT